MVGMVGMVGIAIQVITMNTTMTNILGANHERRIRLRLMGYCFPQRRGVHPLCVQLCSPAYQPRLALIWRVFRLHRGAVRGDVWLSADHLSAVGLARQQISQPRFILT